MRTYKDQGLEALEFKSISWATWMQSSTLESLWSFHAKHKVSVMYLTVTMSNKHDRQTHDSVSEHFLIVSVHKGAHTLPVLETKLQLHEC